MTAQPLYVIYDHPRDYPDAYVLRRWGLAECGGGVLVYPEADPVIVDPDLEKVRSMIPAGLENLGPDDDPVIIEVWL